MKSLLSSILGKAAPLIIPLVLTMAVQLLNKEEKAVRYFSG
jgi:hypothetical protein